MELLGCLSTTLCRGAGIWTPIISLELHQTLTFEGRWDAQPTELQRRGKVDSAVLFSFPDGLHPAEAAPVLRRASGVPHPHAGDLALHRLLASHRCLAFRHIGENSDFETFGTVATVALLRCCTVALLHILQCRTVASDLIPNGLRIFSSNSDWSYLHWSNFRNPLLLAGFEPTTFLGFRWNVARWMKKSSISGGVYQLILFFRLESPCWSFLWFRQCSFCFECLKGDLRHDQGRFSHLVSRLCWNSLSWFLVSVTSGETRLKC